MAIGTGGPYVQVISVTPGVGGAGDGGDVGVEVGSDVGGRVWPINEGASVVGSHVGEADGAVDGVEDGLGVRSRYGRHFSGHVPVMLWAP